MVNIKDNLHFMYWLMLASEDLLVKAIERCEPGRLRNYYIKHLEEERNHAEWMQEDLTKLGVAPTIDYQAAAIAGSQYYHIQHSHPAFLLGYMWVLESAPKPLDGVASLETRYGPLKTLRYHAEHDPDHTRDIVAELDALDPSLRAAVDENAMWIHRWLMGVFSTMRQED